jgi:hypothetical protein
MDEYGSTNSHSDNQALTGPEKSEAGQSTEEQVEKPAEDLMLQEERETGAVSWDVYRTYARDTGSWSLVVFIAVLLVLGQVANVANVLLLGYWSADEIGGFSQGQYMAVYAGECFLPFVYFSSSWGSLNFCRIGNGNGPIDRMSR